MYNARTECLKIYIKETNLYKAKNLLQEFMSADHSLSDDFDPDKQA